MSHAALKQRDDQCPAGHPWVEGSYAWVEDRSGHQRRRCRICHREREHAYRAHRTTARAARRAKELAAEHAVARGMKPARMAEAERPCLRCHKSFKSAHCGNRLCTGCLKL